MRYKIRATENPSLYTEVMNLLQERQVVIRNRNEKRGLVAVEDPSDEVQGEIARLGASIEPELPYALE